eukprot:c14549_g1_i1 orf=505-822(+)
MGCTPVDMYAKLGSIKYARQVFDVMPERDAVSWTVMVAGYAQYGHCQEALEIFWQMQEEGVKPNDVTFICVLKACANVAALEQGKQIHSLIVKSGLDSEDFVGNT